MFNWALDDLKSMGWIAVLIYAVCAALRLARFNVALDRTDLPAWKSSYFVGVPAPAGAIVLLLPIYAQDLGLAFADPHSAGAALYARHRASDGEPRADFLGQADRPEDPARVRASGVRARRALHRLPADLSVADACRGLGHLSRAIPVSAYRYFQVERKMELIAKGQNGKGASEDGDRPPSFPR